VKEEQDAAEKSESTSDAEQKSQPWTRPEVTPLGGLTEATLGTEGSGADNDLFS